LMKSTWRVTCQQVRQTPQKLSTSACCQVLRRNCQKAMSTFFLHQDAVKQFTSSLLDLASLLRRHLLELGFYLHVGPITTNWQSRLLANLKSRLRPRPTGWLLTSWGLFCSEAPFSLQSLKGKTSNECHLTITVRERSGGMGQNRFLSVHLDGKARFHTISLLGASKPYSSKH
jgi:hypothetical protein